MADEIIRIGAVIDLSQILPGLQTLVDQTQVTTAEMKASLASLAEINPVIQVKATQGLDQAAVAAQTAQLMGNVEGAVAAEERLVAAKQQVDEAFARPFINPALVQEQVLNVEALKEKILELNTAITESSTAAVSSAFVGNIQETIVAEEQNALQRQALTQVTEALTAAEASLSEVNALVAGSQEATLASTEAQITASTRLATIKEREVAVNARLATATKQAGAASQEKAALNQAEAASATGVTAASVEQTAAVQAQTEALGSFAEMGAVATAVEEGITAGMIEAAASIGQFSAGLGTTLGAQLTFSNLAIATQKDLALLAEEAMATGHSVEEISTAFLAAGAPITQVVGAFNTLKISLKETDDGIIGFQKGINASAAEMRAAGASATEIAHELQILGLSGRDITTQMVRMGFSAEEVLNAFQSLKITLSSAGNETLRMAAAAGATNEELERLWATMQKLNVSGRNMTNVMGTSRAMFGLLEGSTGMVTSGLARIAAASQVASAAMAAAFPVIIALSFVVILKQVYDEFVKATDAIEGYTEAVKKAHEEDVKASQAAEVHAGSLGEAYQKLGRQVETSGRLAGETWLEQAEKGIDTADKQANHFWDMIPVLSLVHELYIDISGALDGIKSSADEAARAQQNTIKLHEQLVLQLAEEDRVNLKNYNSRLNVLNVGKTRVDQIKQEIEALKEQERLDVSRASREAAAKVIAGTAGFTAPEEAKHRVKEEYAIKAEDLEKKLGVAELEAAVAAGRAVVDGEKTIGLARIIQKQKLTQELYNAGKIGLVKEISDLTAQENEKYGIDKTNLEKRLALAERERGAGKDTTPQIKTLKAELEALETTHQTNLSTITATGEATRRRQAEELQRVTITGQRTINEREVADRKEVYRLLYDSAVISEEEYTNRLLENEDERTAGVKASLEKQRDLVKQFTKPDEQAAKLKQLDDQETEERLRHDADITAILVGSQRRRNDDERRAVEERLGIISREATEKISKEQRVTEEALREIDRRTSFGVISHLEKLRQDLAEIESERKKSIAILNTAIAIEQQAKVAAQSERAQEAATKKIIELESERAKIQDSFDLKRKKAIDDLTNYEIQKQQQAMNIVSASFNSAFDRMLTEHVRFKTVVTKFWDDMVVGWAKMGLDIVAHFTQNMAQLVLQHALALLRIQALDKNSVTFRQALETGWNAIKNALGLKSTQEHLAQKTAEQTADKATQGADVASTSATAAAKTAIITSATIERTTTVATGEVAKTAAVDAASSAQISASAGVAGAAAFASVMEALPFPENVAVAPGVMAEAVSTALSNLAFLTAAKGAVLDKDAVVQAHAKEMILPPPISVGLQNVIATGHIGAPPALTALPNSVSQNQTTIHEDNRQYSSRPHVEVNINGQQHPRLTQEDIESAVMRGIRRGALRFA